MKRQYLITIGIVALTLLLAGCKPTPDNVAISFDGIPIHFEVQGEGTPALVFVHGWSNNKSWWDKQLSYFSQKYEVVAVDLAGFGESGTERKTWTMQAFGEDIVAVVDKLGIGEVILIGFSMGGPVILEAAKRMPDRVIGLVPVDILKNVETTYSQDWIDARFTNWRNTWHDAEVLRAQAFTPESDESHIMRYIDNTPEVPPEYWWESLEGYYHWSSNNCTTTLKKIKAPIISINSDRSPTDVVAFRKYVPSFQVKIIPGVGHFVMWEKPEMFNRLLEDAIQEFTGGSVIK